MTSVWWADSEEDRQIWLYIQTWLPILSIGLTAAICFGIASFAMGQAKSGTGHFLMTLAVARLQILDDVSNLTGMAHGLGMIMAWPVAAREGALIGYGPDYADMYRRVGAYILRIIKGEKPANLPVQEPTKFPLLINAKSAKAIGVSFPPALIVAADEVID